ncbi:MAG: DNA-3-methyladenine glycosylase [Patescibacteria group bacterium]|nr:DNA-3-methyladenine glycosylase [Patescibacteria group bacterium]
MDKKIIEHFRKVDPDLFSVIGKIRPLSEISTSRDYFSHLCEIIINQQLSDKASATIFARFSKLFPQGLVTAEKLLKLGDGKIRQTGPSLSKINFMKGVAKEIVSGRLDLNKIGKCQEMEIRQRLTKIKGIGPWTVEMFLIFSLGKEDVFSPGDLGLRKAIKKLYKFEEEVTIKRAEEFSKKWSPYRSYACRILWRSLEL